MWEKVALAHLQQQSFEAYLPEVLITDRRKRRRIRPLFPNYLFVAFDVMELEWRTIPHTIGVRRLFSSDVEKPIPLPIGFVEELQMHGRPEQPQQVQPHVKEGDLVKLLSGPFKNFSGLVRLDPRFRVYVLLHMLGQDRLVAVGNNSVVKVDG
jgi:transcriptional antiterminator RfaH